jgi:hypothetical protein
MKNRNIVKIQLILESFKDDEYYRNKAEEMYLKIKNFIIKYWDQLEENVDIVSVPDKNDFKELFLLDFKYEDIDKKSEDKITIKLLSGILGSKNKIPSGRYGKKTLFIEAVGDKIFPETLSRTNIREWLNVLKDVFVKDKYKNYFVHEFIHYFDDIRSSGKFGYNTKKINYYESDMEANGYFQSIMYSLQSFLKKNLKHIGSLKNSNNFFKTILELNSDNGFLTVPETDYLKYHLENISSNRKAFEVYKKLSKRTYKNMYRVQ